MRRGAGPAALGLIAAGLTVAALPSAASPQHCPRAESLVPGGHWHHHRIGPGVRLAEAVRHDALGHVSIHVIRIDLGRRRVAVRPLLHTLTRRLPLSALAARRPHLVAAINTGYFDFVTGAPTGPIIRSGRPLVMSAVSQRVVGMRAGRRMQSGPVWLVAHLTTRRGSIPVASINELRTPPGLAIYTPRWGAHRIRGHMHTRLITMHGRTGAMGHARTVPAHGYLLAAHGTAAIHTLRSLGGHTAVGFHATVRTTAAHRFQQAYGVGAAIVRHAGTPRTGFTCMSSNTKTPARTAIGYADDGRRLVFVVVTDHPHTRLHGLDNSQMSKLMVQLGVNKAYDFDGSGSAEMLARLHPHQRLSERTYPADGTERPMPLGLGVFVRS